MKDFKKILSVFALTTFVIIALGFLASNANAVCDGDTGASYGLCIAYCEAMDCDLALTHEVGCEKVNDRYIQINGGLDISCSAPTECDPACTGFESCQDCGFGPFCSEELICQQ